MVHLIRASLRYASKKDWTPLTECLRPIYTAVDETAAAAALDALDGAGGPGIRRSSGSGGSGGSSSCRSWRSPSRVLPVIYTTNLIESMNTRLAEATRNRGQFPSEQAVLKVLYLAVRNLADYRRPTVGIRSSGWKQPLQSVHDLLRGAPAHRMTATVTYTDKPDAPRDWGEEGRGRAMRPLSLVRSSPCCWRCGCRVVGCQRGVVVGLPCWICWPGGRCSPQRLGGTPGTDSSVAARCVGSGLVPRDAGGGGGAVGGIAALLGGLWFAPLVAALLSSPDSRPRGAGAWVAVAGACLHAVPDLAGIGWLTATVGAGVAVVAAVDLMRSGRRGAGTAALLMGLVVGAAGALTAIGSEPPLLPRLVPVGVAVCALILVSARPMRRRSAGSQGSSSTWGAPGMRARCNGVWALRSATRSYGSSTAWAPRLLYVDVDGVPVTPDPGRTVTVVGRSGRAVAALEHDDRALDDPQLQIAILAAGESHGAPPGRRGPSGRTRCRAG